MTNKTEMVSVPREWLNRVSLLQISLDELQDQAAELLADPAEDVRAAVEEPVQQRLLPPAFVQPHPPRHEGFLQPEREVPGYTVEQMKEYGGWCVAAFIKQNKVNP